MNLCKLILRNILENKFRAAIIIISISVSVALFFASFGISKALTNTFVQNRRDMIGNSDILITYNSDKASTPFFYINLEEKYIDKIEYIVGEIVSNAVHQVNNKISWFNFHGIEISDMQTINKISFQSKMDYNYFNGYSVILSSRYAEEYKVGLGDIITFNINQKELPFHVYAIANNVGIFANEVDRYSAIIPKEAFENIYNVKGQVNQLHIKLKNAKNIQGMVNSLSQDFPSLYVKETVDVNDVKSQYEVYSTIFLMMSVVASFMSIFIIYTSFKLLALDRLSTIGTIRSIGATGKKGASILLWEATIYGLIGGIIALVLGIGILCFISKVIMNSRNGIGEINITIFSVLFSLLFAILISISGTIIPVIGVSRFSIRDIMLSIGRIKGKNNVREFIIGSVLLIIALYLPHKVDKNVLLLCTLICIISVIAAMMLILPTVINLFIIIFKCVYKILFGNLGLIAIRNFRENKNYINIIKLYCIGISVVVMLISTGHNVMNATQKIYKIYNSDAVMYTEFMDKKLIKKLETINEVSEVYGNYELWNTKVVGSDYTIEIIDSVDKLKHQQFFHYEDLNNEEELYDRLEKGKNIIISSILADILNAKEGDRIKIKFEENIVEYAIIGVFDIQLNSGRYALISEKNLVEDAGVLNYDRVYLKADKDIEQMIDNIYKKLWNYDIWIASTQERMEQNLQQNQQIFNLIYGFALISILVGTIGVINNFLLNFNEQKKEFGILFSIGLNRINAIKIVILEATFIGLLGGTMGCICGSGMIHLIPYIYKAINYPPLETPMQWSEYITYIIIAIIFSIIVLISNMVRLHNFNVVESIKENQ